MVWLYVWAHNASALVTVECAIELAGFGVALTLEFLVKWSGYINDYNTWEPEANCANSRDIIEEFYKSNPSTP